MGDLHRLDVIQSAHYFATVLSQVLPQPVAQSTQLTQTAARSWNISISPYIFCYIRFTNVKEIPAQAQDILIVIFNPYFLVSNARTKAGMFFR